MGLIVGCFFQSITDFISQDHNCCGHYKASVLISTGHISSIFLDFLLFFFLLVAHQKLSLSWRCERLGSGFGHKNTTENQNFQITKQSSNIQLWHCGIGIPFQRYLLCLWKRIFEVPPHSTHPHVGIEDQKARLDSTLLLLPTQRP